MKIIILTSRALQDLDELKKRDIKLAGKVITLLSEIAANPFSGTGKPEPLKHELSGLWSRRITHEHRLVYKVDQETISVISCLYHYE